MSQERLLKSKGPGGGGRAGWKCNSLRDVVSTAKTEQTIDKIVLSF